MYLDMTKLKLTFILLLHSCMSFSQNKLPHFTPEHFEQQRFAHRGGYANGPENTLQTILFNINSGINAVEIDVMLTKDNQLVLFHDATINRILDTKSDKDVFLDQLGLRELQKIPLRDTSKGVQFVCSLEELIDTLVVLIPKSEINDFLLEVDFKPHGDKAIEGVNALVNILNDHLADFGENLYNYFFISTFYPSTLKQLYKTNPKIVTAYAVHNSPDENKLMAKLGVLLAPRFVKKYKADIIEPNICMIDEKFVKKWHNKGAMINTYTANTKCEKEYLENFQIAYTSNCPVSYCKPDLSDQVSNPKKWCKKCN